MTQPPPVVEAALRYVGRSDLPFILQCLSAGGPPLVERLLWCVGFVNLVTVETRGALPWPHTLSCEHLRRWFAGQGLLVSDPQPGDLVWYDWDGDGDPDHIGIVQVATPRGSLTSIEGNHHDAVAVVERAWRYAIAFGRLP